ncbi:MAG TPA: D-aminoacylase [Chitinophagaceae bacterium]|nr:D-aminoacylase [Chitinophagaceae bacterium]HRG91995.1 D-aminoacylase [Chitinophagaceae bacterium]
MRLLSLIFLFPLLATAQEPFDILIKNGKIIDGSGNNWYYSDLAIKNGKIVQIARDIKPGTAKKIIDAKGMIVAPGFIDVHTHLEEDEAKDPETKSFIYDGVTTCITGNCGSSNVDIAKYLNWLDSLKLSINVATLAGHNDIRKSVMGRANRDASADEMKRMEAIMQKAMQDGAVGLSTGLIYIPGTYTKTPEIVSLAKIAAQYNGVYATHMRDEGDSITYAIEEALTIGREAKIPVEISHFKCSGQHNWGRSKETIPMVEAARREGIEVTIDQYPYTASSTSISTLLPDEVLADGQDSIRARLQRPAIRKQVTDHILARLKKRKLKHLSYAVVANYSPDTSYNGKSIEAINLMKGRKHKARYEAETVMDLMMNGGASAVFHGMSEEDVKNIMRYPFNMFASDASIRVLGAGMPHPRGYGTNARVLSKYVREEKVISLEEAIRRMTSLPAQKFQLKDRGLIREGMAADIVIFNENEVKDISTFEKPHAYSKGFYFVLVNGVLTVDQQQHTGARAGKALRHTF